MNGALQRNRSLMAAGLVVVALLLLDVTPRIERYGYVPITAMPPNLLNILRIALGAMAMINVIQPYFLRKQFQLARERSLFPVQPELRPFVMGLMFSCTPLVYTVFLFAVGDPAHNVLYGALLTILAVLAWTLYNSR